MKEKESDLNRVAREQEKSIEIWRDIAKRAIPLFEKSLVVNTEPDGTKVGSICTYCTDGNGLINAFVHEPEKLMKHIREDVVPMYKIAVNATDKNELADSILLNNFIYLLFHEQIHNTDCPQSREDQKEIMRSLKEGICEELYGSKKAPKGKTKEAVTKTLNARNVALDQIVDFLHYVRSRGKIGGNLPKWIERSFQDNVLLEGESLDNLLDGTELVWDVVEIANSKNAEYASSDAVFPVTRMPYAVQFVENEHLRKRLVNLFEKTATSANVKNPKQTMVNIFEGYLREIPEEDLIKLGIEKEYAMKIFHDVATGDGNFEENRDFLYMTLEKIFVNNTRYDSMRGYVKPLAKILSGSQVENTKNHPSGEGEGMMEDLMDILEPDEILDLSSERNGTIPGGRGSGQTGTELNVKKYAADEFYKRVSNEIKFKTPKTEITSKDRGKMKIWQIASSTQLTYDEFYEDISIEEGADIHQDVVGDDNQVLIFDDEEQEVIINRYVQSEIDVKSWEVTRTGPEFPDYFGLLGDSSGSMFSGYGKTWVGGQCRYNIMTKIVYGLWKSLKNASETYKRDIKVGFGNFSDVTTWSGFEDVNSVYDSTDNKVKNDILSPQQRGTGIISPERFDEIVEGIEPGNKSLVGIISDGCDPITNGCEIIGRIEKFAKKPNNSVVWIEIGVQSNYIGMMMEGLSRKYKNIIYKNVDDIGGIKKPLEELIIQYK